MFLNAVDDDLILMDFLDCAHHFIYLFYLNMSHNILFAWMCNGNQIGDFGLAKDLPEKYKSTGKKYVGDKNSVVPLKVGSCLWW